MSRHHEDVKNISVRVCQNAFVISTLKLCLPIPAAMLMCPGSVCGQEVINVPNAQGVARSALTSRRHAKTCWHAIWERDDGVQQASFFILFLFFFTSSLSLRRSLEEKKRGVEALVVLPRVRQGRETEGGGGVIADGGDGGGEGGGGGGGGGLNISSRS